MKVRRYAFHPLNRSLIFVILSRRTTAEIPNSSRIRPVPPIRITVEMPFSAVYSTVNTDITMKRIGAMIRLRERATIPYASTASASKKITTKKLSCWVEYI